MVAVLNKWECLNGERIGINVQYFVVGS